jgi:hypothetical protein
MKIVNFCLMTGLVLGLPTIASAQQNVAGGTSSDIKYCNALAKSYSSLFPAQEGMPASDVTTLARCDSDPRPTIAVLEKKLSDKKIDLPHDDRVAQPPGSTGNGQ